MSKREYPKLTRDMAALLLRRLRHLRARPVEVILAWVQWFANRGLALAVTVKGRVDSVCLFRRIHNQEQGETLYEHHPDGPIAYIEACAARSGGRGMRPMFNLFFVTEGHKCSHMAWNRLKHGERVTLTPVSAALRLMSYPGCTH